MREAITSDQRCIDCISLLSVLLCVSFFLTPAVAQHESRVSNTTETLISEIPTRPEKPRFFWCSPDGRHVAHDHGKGRRVFSLSDPDWTKIRYTSHCLVLDGEEQEHFDDINWETVGFSPDGRLAYGARRGAKWHVVLDGKEVAGFGSETSIDFDSIGRLTFSPDGKRLAFYAVDGKPCVVVDGKAGKRYDRIDLIRGSLLFSPDGRRLAYLAEEFGGKSFLVLDGREYGECSEMPSFSADGRHVAYTDGHAVFVDGEQVSKRYPEVLRVRISPNGKRVAYKAKERGNFVLVVDDEEYPGYSNHSPVFSPDSSRLAYQSVDEKGSFVVLDEKPGARFRKENGVRCLTFSPDSRRFAYVGTYRQFEHCVVVDGKVGERHSDSNILDITFSPDGSRLAYRVRGVNGGEYVVVDGKAGKRYHGIRGLRFSPDGEHLACWARWQDQCFVVVDGKEGKRYDQLPRNLLPGGPVVFDSPDELHYISLRDGKLYMVDEVLK